jgi:hypothetical protein
VTSKGVILKPKAKNLALSDFLDTLPRCFTAFRMTRQLRGIQRKKSAIEQCSAENATDGVLSPY